MTHIVHFKSVKTDDFAFLSHCEKAFLKSLDQCKLSDQCKCKIGSQCKCTKIPILPLLLELSAEPFGHCHCYSSHHCTCSGGGGRDKKSKEKQSKMSDEEKEPEPTTSGTKEEVPSTSSNTNAEQINKFENTKTNKKSKDYKGAIFTLEKDGFHICMDVKKFRLSELSVKVIDNETIVIEAKHGEREDSTGTVSRQIMRKYQIPKECDPEEVHAEISSDGILTVKAPLRKNKPSQERNIDIKQIGNGSCHSCPCMVDGDENDKEENGEANI